MTDSEVWAVFQILYRAYSAACETLEKLSKEKPDGSQDWQLFHDERVKNCRSDLERITNLKNLYREHFDTEIERFTDSLFG